MTSQNTLALLAQAEKRFEQEKKLIELDSGIAVFVGDTHGDIEATKRVIDRHLSPEKTLVFLGDYVDRGPASAENLHLLLSLKVEQPDNIFLLMGNHEGRGAVQFFPADFWSELGLELRARYVTVLSKLPLAVSTSNGIIALHGALPAVDHLEDINEISFGSTEWRHITWGDWQEQEGGFLGFDDLSGRPQFGQDWFDSVMDKLGKRVLVRSHQPNTRRKIFGERCLTIFTSSVYLLERTVAIADLSKEIDTADDLVIETV